MTVESGRANGLGETERTVLSGLAALERPAVGAADVVRQLGLSRKAANLILSRLARKGWLTRLRRGVYAVVPLSSPVGEPVVEQPLAVAMELFAPCYISGWTAAQHWELTEQISNTIVVYSAKPQRRADQIAGGVNFRVHRVIDDAIFGTTKVWSGTVSILMASMHRTVIDVLDTPELGGGGRQTHDIVRSYWKHPDREPAELLDLAERLGRGSIFKRLGFTAERFGQPDAEWLARCEAGLSTGIALLDPSGPKRGPIVSRWRLRVNIPVNET
ncbi:MAG: type IV toxin-antitoxin system AbiEi family antitoxin domain-containing protein [Dehalococcoidia bacterium]